MRGRVRKNQWIEGVVFNGSSLLMTEQRGVNPQEDRDKLSQQTTTVFVCDGFHLKIGVMPEVGCFGYCVKECDPEMRWKNFNQYFGEHMVRVITCYLKTNQNLNKAAEELAEYIIMQQIMGKILLVGFSQGGLVMYRAGTLVPLAGKRKITVMTVAAPFAEVRGKNILFGEALEALPPDRNHISFINVSSERKSKKCLEKLFSRKQEEDDPIIPFEIQDKVPKVGVIRREPDMCLLSYIPLDESLEHALKELGLYAGGEYLFSLLDDFQRSDVVKRMTGDRM